MSATATESQSALGRLLAPLWDCLTPEVARRIAALRADADTVALLDALAEKNAEGTITPDERAEYEALVSALNWINLLQVKARAIAAG